MLSFFYAVSLVSKSALLCSVLALTGNIRRASTDKEGRQLLAFATHVHLGPKTPLSLGYREYANLFPWRH